SAINNEVYSLVQNVTVEVSFQNRNLFQSRKLRRPRFSFFSSSIVKELTRKNQSKTIPAIPSSKPRTTNQHRSQSRKQ
ncbi:hypothetical protein, partial [Rhizobium sp. BR 314]|uniref:hypothetical protein n=1 Tax=Rhizobium sp. BR 314 TaxID=3040013 RepID=UPI0039BF602E